MHAQVLRRMAAVCMQRGAQSGGIMTLCHGSSQGRGAPVPGRRLRVAVSKRADLASVLMAKFQCKMSAWWGSKMQGPVTCMGAPLYQRLTIGSSQGQISVWFTTKILKH